MRLSKKRKVYVCVLAVAVLVLLVDRAFLGPAGLAPQEASAGPAGASKPPTGVGEGGSTGAARTADAGPEQSVVARLRALAQTQPETTDVRDAFRPSSSWLAEMRRADRAEGSGADAAPRRSFDHRLVAVMVDGQGGMAIIDGRCLRVGQTMDGFTLVRLGKNSAVLQANGRKVELTLDRDNPKSGM